MPIFKRVFLTLAIVAASAGCDQATKHWANQELVNKPTQSFLGDTFRLTYALNDGAFLSLGDGGLTIGADGFEHLCHHPRGLFRAMRIDEVQPRLREALVHERKKLRHHLAQRLWLARQLAHVVPVVNALSTETLAWVCDSAVGPDDFDGVDTDVRSQGEARPGAPD